MASGKINKTYTASEVDSKLQYLDGTFPYAPNQNPDDYTDTIIRNIGILPAKSPTGSAIYGYLLVFSNGNVVVQVFIATTNNTIYYRTK